MKRLFNILFALAGVCLVSCNEDIAEPVKTVSPAVVGDWHLTEEYSLGEQVPQTADVYLSINSDCTFELYQKSGTQIRFSLYTGTCYSEDNLLIGVYSDGTPWGSDYEVSFNVDGHLVLTTYDRMGKMIYEKKSIPAEEKNLAVNVTKSDITAETPKL